MLEIQDILKEEGDATVQRIAGNIFRNKQNASGKTIASLKNTTTPTSLDISGASHIKTLQTGVLPGTFVTAATINTWANNKGYWSGYNYRANTIARRIFNFGSLLYRKGGRQDVWSNEVQLLVERIENRIEQRFYEIKIVE